MGWQAYVRSLSAALMMGCLLQAQEFSPHQRSASTTTQTYHEEEIQQHVAVPCVEPPPLVRWSDYQGKIGEVGGMFARKLERKSVQMPHYKPRAVLCTLEPKDKLLFFVHATVDPLTFVDAAYDAGIDQAERRDPTFGRVPPGIASASAPALPAGQQASSSKTLPTPRCFRKTLATIDWFGEERAIVCSTQQDMCSSRTGRTGHTCSISLNGSAHQALSC